MKFYKGAEVGIFIGHWYGPFDTEDYYLSHKKTADSFMGARRNVSIIIQSCASGTIVLI
jgi:hypothetical protein